MKAFNWFVHAPIGQACPLVLAGRLAAILTVPLLSLFIVSLAAENQRMFVSCRLAGASADACILSIHGR